MTVCGSTAATERNGPFSFSFLLFSAKFVFFYTWTDTLDETVGARNPSPLNRNPFDVACP